MARWLFLLGMSCGLALLPALVMSYLADTLSADAGVFTGLFVFVALVGVLMTETEDKA